MTVPTIKKANGHPPSLLPSQLISITERPPGLHDKPDSTYDHDDLQAQPDDGQQEKDDGGYLSVLTAGAVGMGAVVAGIGFIGSYGTLRNLADRKNFGDFSYLFPIGIDAGIIALQAIDLYLVHKRVRLPLLRWIALGLTLATIAFNAAASGPILKDPLAAAMHGIIPILYIAAVEAARHYIGRRNKLLHGAADLGMPPLNRWILSPFKTAHHSRQMVLWNKPYAIVVAMAHGLAVYEERLHQKHGEEWRTKAKPDELLPFKMAQAGFSVDQALAIPFEEEMKAARRTGEAALQRAAAEVQQIHADLQIREERLQAQAAEIRADGQLKLAEIETKAAIDNELQLREVELQRQAADHQAQLQKVQDEAAAEIQAIQDETANRRFLADLERKNQQLKARMEEKRLEVEADRQNQQIELEAAEHAARMGALGRLAKSEELLTAQQNELDAAEAARKAVETRQATVEVARTAAEDERTAEEARAAAAEFRAKTAADTERAVEAERRATESRARVAEAAARERLGQVDFDVVRIMGLLVAAEDENTVTNDVIERELGCSTGTASTRRGLAKKHLEDPDSPLQRLFWAAYRGRPDAEALEA
ncbi:DUF2637 domain-containing protein [Kitasatospora sp. NBC_01300]|uniref:DUF2637 domain-containing protein n=1 Tax=Kitasatospora sp. NBC_01300 TaxID=2903574 RepID=UPI002F911AD5|nr:DUF2637 domain-containing protein [Kitasatospora sp. NBC_01300]